MKRKWSKEKPERSGWYWCTPDPKGKDVGVYYYKPNCCGIITNLIATNENMYFSGPIQEPTL